MGRYTDRFRSIIKDLPSADKVLESPQSASQCIAQLANGALRIVAGLEEQNEDQLKEIHQLQERLMEAGLGGEAWKP